MTSDVSIEDNMGLRITSVHSAVWPIDSKRIALHDVSKVKLTQNKYVWVAHRIDHLPYWPHLQITIISCPQRKVYCPKVTKCGSEITLRYHFGSKIEYQTAATTICSKVHGVVDVAESREVESEKAGL